jgi:hypothetical protein
MKPEPENLPRALMASIDNEHVRDDMVALSDALLDDTLGAILKSDTLKKVPIVGIMVAIGNGALDIRDRLFVRKLLVLLAATGDASKADRERFRAKLDGDPKVAQKAGATILELIDKATGVEKAAMIGRVLKACMHEDDLTFDETIAICEMIERAYLDDLRALARPDGETGPPWNDVNLEGVGIKKSMRSEDVKRAIEAAIGRMTSQMPVIHERPIKATGDPKVIESGLTDRGANLRRILREY